MKKKRSEQERSQKKKLSDLIPQDTLKYYLECYKGMNKLVDYVPDFPFNEIEKIGNALLKLQKRKWLDPDDSDMALSFLLDKIFQDNTFSQDDPELIDSQYSRYLFYKSLRRKSRREGTSQGKPGAGVPPIFQCHSGLSGIFPMISP